MVLQVVLKLLIVLRRLFTSYKALATKNAKKSHIKWRTIKLLSKLSSDCLHEWTNTISEDDPSLLVH